MWRLLNQDEIVVVGDEYFIDLKWFKIKTSEGSAVRNIGVPVRRKIQENPTDTQRLKAEISKLKENLEWYRDNIDRLRQLFLKQS